MKHKITLLGASILTFITLLFIAIPVSQAQTGTALSSGSYEDNHAAFTYSGAWTLHNHGSASGGSYRYSNDPNARVTFSFTGSKLTIIRAVAYNRGAMEVCIDTTCQRVENYNANVYWQQPVSLTTTAGTHNVTIRNLSNAYIDFDAFRIEGDGGSTSPTTVPTLAPTLAPTTQPIAGAFAAGYYEDTVSGLSITGAWTIHNYGSASGGVYRYSNDPNARITFSFTGSKLTIIRALAYNRGPMEVCIDSTCQRVENYNTNVYWQQPVSLTTTAGTHNVTIRNLSGAYIDFDAFRVEGDGGSTAPTSPTATPTIAPTTQPIAGAFAAGYYEDTVSGLSITGAWTVHNYASASGASYRYSNDPNARITFSFTGSKLTIIRAVAYNRGAMEVCIDTTCQRVENYNANVYWQQPVSLNTTAATHNVTIRNLSTAYIDFDAFRVENTTIAPTAVPTIAPTVAPTLPAPGIVDPANGAQIAYSAQPFTYNWDAVSGAIGYHIQIATDLNFANLAYDVTPTSDGWAAQSPFNAGTYYWRVRARTSTSSGAWSAVRSVVINAAAPPPTAPHLSPMAYRAPYTANGPWNTPIGANPQYDQYSSQMISLWGTNATGGRITSDTTQYTYPVYFADKNTPRYNIPCVKYKCSVVDDAGNVTRVTTINNVPIPDGAQQSAGTDAQMIIIDSETGEEWGFYEMYKQSNGSWQAGNGYRYHMNYTGSTPGFGSRGAGVPYYAGLIRAHEIRNGEINHAIAFVYQFTAVKGCVYPATMTDGKNTNAYAIPEGARIQLNPNLTEADFDRMGLTRAGKIVARAMQKYGLILIDSGGSSKIIAENLSANTLYGESWSDPDLQYTKSVVQNIPVTEYRVLALPDGYHNNAAANWGRCVK